MAIILAKTGNLQDAVEYTRKIFSKGLVAEVIEEYKKSSPAGLEESQIHINLGLFYQEMGFIEEAILEYQQAAQDPGKLMDAYNRMALCFKQEGFVRSLPPASLSGLWNNPDSPRRNTCLSVITLVKPSLKTARSRRPWQHFTNVTWWTSTTVTYLKR